MQVAEVQVTEASLFWRMALGGQINFCHPRQLSPDSLGHVYAAPASAATPRGCSKMTAHK